jgi:hypothetical protein
MDGVERLVEIDVLLVSNVGGYDFFNVLEGGRLIGDDTMSSVAHNIQRMKYYVLRSTTLYYASSYTQQLERSSE